MEDFLEKEVLRMLRLIRSLFKERPLPLQQAALQQGISVKTIRRMIASELGIKLPIKFLIKKANLIIYRRKQCRLLSYKKSHRFSCKKEQ